MIDGKVDGRRGRGRPKARWIDDVRKMTGQSIDQLNVAAVLDRGGAGSDGLERSRCRYHETMLYAVNDLTHTSI